MLSQVNEEESVWPPSLNSAQYVRCLGVCFALCIICSADQKKNTKLNHVWKFLQLQYTGSLNLRQWYRYRINSQAGVHGFSQMGRWAILRVLFRCSFHQCWGSFFVSCFFFSDDTTFLYQPEENDPIAPRKWLFSLLLFCGQKIFCFVLFSKPRELPTLRTDAEEDQHSPTKSLENRK